MHESAVARRNAQSDAERGQQKVLFAGRAGVIVVTPA
jgi:hypothetical protein